MKLRVCALSVAALALCSSSIATAKVARPSKSALAMLRGKSGTAASKASASGSGGGGIGLAPIVAGGVLAGGLVIYLATKEDKPASR